MSVEILPSFDDIGAKRVNVAEGLARILTEDGNAIHGYSDSLGKRKLMVLETPEYSDGAPLLGYGEDHTAERALARAVLTYGFRDELGIDYIKETQFPQSCENQKRQTRHASKFDLIVWGASFSLHQSRGDYIASSGYGGGDEGMQPLSVVAIDAVSAIDNLCESYSFPYPGAARLPNLSTE